MQMRITRYQSMVTIIALLFDSITISLLSTYLIVIAGVRFYSLGWFWGSCFRLIVNEQEVKGRWRKTVTDNTYSFTLSRKRCYWLLRGRRATEQVSACTIVGRF